VQNEKYAEWKLLKYYIKNKCLKLADLLQMIVH